MADRGGFDAEKEARDLDSWIARVRGEERRSRLASALDAAHAAGRAAALEEAAQVCDKSRGTWIKLIDATQSNETKLTRSERSNECRALAEQIRALLPSGKEPGR